MTLECKEAVSKEAEEKKQFQKEAESRRATEQQNRQDIKVANEKIMTLQKQLREFSIKHDQVFLRLCAILIS